MKILLCVNSDIGRKNTIGFRFGKIATELEKNKINFELIARANYISNLKCLVPFYKNYLARFLNAIRIYIFSRFDSRTLDVKLFDHFVLNILKKNKEVFNLAHLGEFLPKSIDYLHKQGVKVFLDVPIGHDSYSLNLKNRGLVVGVNVKESPKYVDNALQKSDVLVTPSEFVKETLKVAGFDEKKIVIIPFGADVNNKIKENDILEKNVDKISFVFAGNVNYRKGIKYLLDAWEKVEDKNTELIICGRIYKEVRNEIKSHNFINVKFVGFVDVEDYLKKAHVFVLPTLLEGSAKAIYEAMSFGLPIITTPNSGSIVEDGVSGFIVPIGDADKIAEKINFYCTNKDEIKNMGLNALNKIKNYTWDNYAHNIIDLYKL